MCMYANIKGHFMCFLYMSCSLFAFLVNCHLRHVDCYVMLGTSFWWWWRLRVSCVRCVHIYRTYTWHCMHYHTSVLMIVQWSITSVVLSACIIDQSNWVLLSWWFKVSCCEVMLSACSQDHACTSSPVHTLGHFFKFLSTKPSSNNRTSTKLHCTISTLNDYVLLPRIA